MTNSRKKLLLREIVLQLLFAMGDYQLMVLKQSAVVFLPECFLPPHKQEAVQRHWVRCLPPPDQSFGEHDPLVRMENMTPPGENGEHAPSPQ